MTSRSLSPSSGHSREVPAANDLDSKWHLWGAMLSFKTQQVWCSSNCCPEQSMYPKAGAGLPAWDETPLDIGTVCVGGVWCLLRCTHRGKGGTRDANGHAALPVCDTCSRLLLAQVYNKGFYAKVAFNKGLKVTCVSLQPKAVDDYRGLDGPTLKWPWFLCLWLQGFFKPMLNSPLWIKPDFVLWFCAPTVINFTQWV